MTPLRLPLLELQPFSVATRYALERQITGCVDVWTAMLPQ